MRRSTGELLLLLIAGTVCFAVIATGAAITLLAILRPEFDTSNAGRVLTDLINTLIGLLAGFMAGRTDMLRDREIEKALDRERQKREQGHDS